jgi:hypothetical protein
VAGRISSIEISSDLIWNRTCELPACSIVPQLTTLPRAPFIPQVPALISKFGSRISSYTPELIGENIQIVVIDRQVPHVSLNKEILKILPAEQKVLGRTNRLFFFHCNFYM